MQKLVLSATPTPIYYSLNFKINSQLVKVFGCPLADGVDG